MPRYRYDRQHTPPAPVLPVRVGRPGEAPEIFFSALLDTGADLSVLPLGLPAQLRLPAVGRLIVAGIDGPPRPLPVYAVEVSVDGYRTIARAVSLGTTPLIGRELMNKMLMRLDGLNGVLEVTFP